jgi:uncharacterized protein (DUF1697 family)
LFAGIGFSNVETFIASGNVIFDSPSKSTKVLEKKIETFLFKTLGYEVATFVRSTSELSAIAQHQPFAAAELSAAGNFLFVGFMAAEPADTAKQKLKLLTTKRDDFHLQGREVYWLCRTGFSQSEISGAMLAKALGMPATIRNSTTIKKLAAKYS